ncbi:MAG: hypothetical protein D4R64_11910 [Porphyromonadaceae bacterium]|nr:MAG: hypothetical protein D4R64_11910 [Porphyromonadaceae bacterium]
MASKKNLKKDIDYLITDVILDCYACMEEHPEKDFSAYEEIINEIIIVKGDLLDRINHFDLGNHGKSRPYFLGIKRDLVKNITAAHEKLIELGC